MAETPTSRLQKRTWVTLLTRASYLPGVVLLAHSLHAHRSKYPLLILVTPSLPSSLLSTLAVEAKLANASLLLIQPLSPPPNNKPGTLIASRFEDTWTKLRAFDLYSHGYEKVVFLDADMLIRRDMDELFDVVLPGIDWIAANHACVCNLDKDSWAPESWTKENCGYTGLQPTSAPTPVPFVDCDKSGDEWSEPCRLLNSGMFIFTPHQSQWEHIVSFLNTDERVKTFMFPDQDFLAAFFLNRWKSLGWQYNALKTMRYWHEHMWSDEEVRNLHYIVDKPWGKRIGIDGTAGYLGRDGITHQWWWNEYEKWMMDRERTGHIAVLRMMADEVAQPLREHLEELQLQNQTQGLSHVPIANIQ